jgi:hypothetical protein
MAEYEGPTYENSKDGAELANSMSGEGKRISREYYLSFKAHSSQF